MHHSLLAQFKAVSIHGRIDPFFEADILHFLETPMAFSLNLKRAHHQLALYGVDHVAIRQAFFNNQSCAQRLAIFKQKITAIGLVEWIENALKISVHQLIDVTDIGKGRTIYKLQFSNGVSMVLKEKCNNTQQQLNQLAIQFGVSVGTVHFHNDGHRLWELSEFLNESGVFHLKRSDLLIIYARAAAFGDFIGLGDRHFENYILKEGHLISIDVAHLMDTDNCHWTEKYISGGLYEVCLLQSYIEDGAGAITSAMVLFLTEYSHRMVDLFNQGHHVDLPQFYWVDYRQCLQKMIPSYLPSLMAMFDRLHYKFVLTQLVHQGVSLEAYPELKMYYHADKSRISTFFRSEELSVPIFDQIESLSIDGLGLGQSYFDDKRKSLNNIQKALQSAITTVLNGVPALSDLKAADDAGLVESPN
jgi:hypothetical protein